MRKIILSIIGVLLIAGSTYFAFRLADNKYKSRPVPQKVVKTVFIDTVKNTTIPIVIPSNGSLVAKRRVELFSEVQGIFKPRHILFKPGQEYAKGQILIKIDDSEYYATVQSAKSNLYNSIIALMPDLRLDFPNEHQKWQEYINSFDLDKTTPKLPKTNSDKENYFITGRGIVSGYYNVKNLEQRLSKYTIVAPFSGVLTESLVTEGSLVRNGQKLGMFIDPSVYEMEVAISKSLSNLLKVGEQVTLHSLDSNEDYKGVVARINGSVNPTTQTISVFIEVKDSSLKEGMYLEAQLNAKKETNAIEIDRSLLLPNNQIFVVKDSLLNAIPVNPVFFTDTKVVLKNVPDGALILTRPVQGAYAGMLVKVLSNNSSN